MTIAEKLTKIAENMQKIYDAGYAKGYAKCLEDNASKVIITFEIEWWGTYEAEEGMTWGEWAASDYNTDGAYVSDWNSITNGVASVRLTDGTPVSPNDIITAGTYYQAV